MSYRLTKIYTRQGDDGYTSLRNQRLSKDDLLLEALGTVDELNASIGLITVCSQSHQTIVDFLQDVQNELFNLGAELHMPERVAITTDKVSQLEQALDAWNDSLPPLQEFILPGGNPSSAATHFARTVCRRAERSLVRLHRQLPINLEMLRYVNRLSDVLFVIARVLGREDGNQEKMWDK